MEILKATSASIPTTQPIMMTMLDLEEVAGGADVELAESGLHNAGVLLQRPGLPVIVTFKPGLLSKLGGTEPVKLLPSKNLHDNYMERSLLVHLKHSTSSIV